MAVTIIKKGLKNTRQNPAKPGSAFLRFFAELMRGVSNAPRGTRT
jgi:hypothetical protein